MKITEDQVFEVIESFGAMGATKKQVAKRLGAALEAPTYRAEQLIKAGLVMKSKHGKEVVYIVKPKVAKVDVPLPVKPVADIELLKQNAETLEREYRREVGMEPELGALYATHKQTDLDETINIFVTAIANKVIERMRPTLVEMLRDSVGKMAEEIVVSKPVEFPKPKPKPKLPSILIGGLHPDQTHMILKEFEGVADLRFVGADESNSVWKSRAANAQHTVLMVDFLSHKHIESVKATGVTPIILRGGLTKLRDELMELSV